MGRYPVTVYNYLQFIESGGYRDEKLWTAGGYGAYSEPDHWPIQLRYPNRPVVYVNWFEAGAYCAWAGGKLPTEAEWECAARSVREGARYPWGDEAPDAHRANAGESGPGHLTPVGLYPEGAAPNGIQDLAGNCYEWVDDWWSDDYKKQGEGEQRVLRGVGWSDAAEHLRVSVRTNWAPGDRNLFVGFRCVRDLPA
jgi:formylglycine-generating enzyme required for sulfatase activity